MKTKRELLKHFAKCGNCEDIACTECPYYEVSKHCPNNNVSLKKIGAMAILRMFKEKKKPLLEVGTKIRFDNGKVYNIEKNVALYNREEYCLRDKNTMVCYPIDYLIGKTWEVIEE